MRRGLPAGSSLSKNRLAIGPPSGVGFRTCGRAYWLYPAATAAGPLWDGPGRPLRGTLKTALRLPRFRRYGPCGPRVAWALGLYVVCLDPRPIWGRLSGPRPGCDRPGPRPNGPLDDPVSGRPERLPGVLAGRPVGLPGLGPMHRVCGPAGGGRGVHLHGPSGPFGMFLIVSGPSDC